MTEYQLQHYCTAVYNSNTSFIPSRSTSSHVDIPSVSNDTIEETVVTSSSDYFVVHVNSKSSTHHPTFNDTLLSHDGENTDSSSKVTSYIMDVKVLDNDYQHKKSHLVTSNVDTVTYPVLDGFDRENIYPFQANGDHNHRHHDTQNSTSVHQFNLPHLVTDNLDENNIPRDIDGAYIGIFNKQQVSDMSASCYITNNNKDSIQENHSIRLLSLIHI